MTCDLSSPSIVAWTDSRLHASSESTNVLLDRPEDGLVSAWAAFPDGRLGVRRGGGVGLWSSTACLRPGVCPSTLASDQ